MKFFFKQKTNIFFTKNQNGKYFNTNLIKETNPTNLSKFIVFLTKKGLHTKEKKTFKSIFKNFNFFFNSNVSYLYANYPNVKWILEDMFENKHNVIYLFNIILNLIKPPFVVKSTLIPKKLRKKTKQKYLIKIVYKNDNKRLNSSYKQLYYYSNKFTDSSYKIRLYKSLMFSFLDWKNSHLFKLKTMVFKKFFKF